MEISLNAPLNKKVSEDVSLIVQNSKKSSAKAQTQLKRINIIGNQANRSVTQLIRISRSKQNEKNKNPNELRGMVERASSIGSISRDTNF